MAGTTRGEALIRRRLLTHDDLGVMHPRRFSKEFPDQAAPRLVVFRLPKMDHMVLHGVPVHNQRVAQGMFDGSPQCRAAAAAGALEQG